MHPCVARLQAVLATFAARLHVLDVVFLMRAFCRHVHLRRGLAFTPYIVSPARGTPQLAPLPKMHRVPVPQPAVEQPVPPSPPRRVHLKTMPVFSAPVHP